MEVDERDISHSAARLRGTPGTLILTNRRILFTHGSGLLKQRTYFVLDLALPSVRQVAVERGMLKARLVMFAQGEGYSGLPRIEIEISNPEGWASAIWSQVSQRKKELDDEMRRSKVQYVIDFSFLKDRLARGGMNVQVIKCPSCGANVDMPDHGTCFKCSYCGSTVQSQDVFERMKSLLTSL